MCESQNNQMREPVLYPCGVTKAAVTRGSSGAPTYRSHAQLSYQLGFIVFRRRAQLGISQKTLSERAGISTVACIEAGRQNPTIHTLARLCIELDLRLSTLFGAIESDVIETDEASILTEPAERLENPELLVSGNRYKLGKVVRKRRTQLGLVQRELGQRSGLATSAVSIVESGGQDVTLNTLARICAGLDCRFSELCAAIESDPAGANESFARHELKEPKASLDASAPRPCGQTEFPLCQLVKVVRKRRIHLGLSQGEVEEHGGLPRRCLQSIESGRRNIRKIKFTKLVQLSAGLGLPLSELCAEIEVCSSEMKKTYGKEEANTTADGLILPLSQMYRSREQLLHQLGKAVLIRRTTRGMSQLALGECTGHGRRRIAIIEAGRQNMTLYSLARICAGLNMPLWELAVAIDGNPDETKEPLDSISV
jgi:transcriptional regulator with XRE-family HTH domain